MLKDMVHLSNPLMKIQASNKQEEIVLMDAIKLMMIFNQKELMAVMISILGVMILD